MTDVLAVGNGSVEDRAAVDALATATAAVVGGRVRPLQAAPDGATGVLAALEGTDVALAVLSARADLDLVRAVVALARKPVAVIPTARAARSLGRVLLPLDGTAESTAAVERWVGVFDRAGVDVVVLHVFEAATAPRYWDHAAHADAAWRQAFVTRHRLRAGVHLEMRSGQPGETVAFVAAQEHVDLVVLGWSQHLEPARAKVVQAAIEQGPVPVLLVPMSRDSTGRSALRVAPGGGSDET